MSTELIKLGIAVDYPVRWKFDKVLRDLIQNFFDSVGSERFGEEVDYRYSKEERGYSLTIKTAGHPFDYEWLVYIGGSTKTGKAQYIGQYGEGFKVCMLSLLKYGISDICMHSQDWKLVPCIYEEKIDGRRVQMLGYQMEKVPDDGITLLEIHGIPFENVCYLKEGPLHFFYSGNPLFGDKIGESSAYTVYGSSGMKIPCRDWQKFQGILYLNHLARGRLPIPFFVNLENPSRSDETRERHVMHPMRVMENMYTLALLLSAEDSLTMLVQLEQFWNDLPQRLKDGRTWYYVICQLVRNVAGDKTTAQRFETQYAGKLAYLERKNSDRLHNQRVDRAAVWAREYSEKRLVNPIFRLLGAENLMETFEREHQEDLHQTDLLSRKRFRILCEALRSIVPGLVGEDLEQFAEPGVLRIGAPEYSEMDPLVGAGQISGVWRRRGIRPKYQLNELIFAEKDFADGAFDQSFIKLADKALHIYGSSRSERVNDILTDLGQWLIDNGDQLDRYRQAWANV